VSTFRCDTFTNLDSEVISDFNDCFREAAEEIEECCNKLDREYDAEVVHTLFRSMHSLKGNCRMVFLDPMVNVCHMLEEIVSDIRADKYSYDPVYGEFMVVVISLIRVLVAELLAQGEAQEADLQRIESYILQVKEADIDLRVAVVNQILDDLSGAATEAGSIAQEAPAEEISESVEELTFFYDLALKLDTLKIFHRERVAKVLKFCLDMNEQMGGPVSEEQLSAAVYIHDVGLAFVPRRILQKEGVWPRDEEVVFYDHVNIGAELLRRIPGWEEAAFMVEQHHERFDGKGHPRGLSGEQIHVGAQIIAVADTYQQVLGAHSDASFRKTLIRAVTEVNSNMDFQFSLEVVEAFNIVVREEFVAG